jgi:uncharacterized membrane protein
MEYERIYALYRNFEDAASAVNELVREGFSADNISMVTRDHEGRYSQYVDGVETDVDAGDAAGFGAATGALVGLAALALPGIGPIIAAGPLAAALAALTTGAVTGAATGGVVGALMDWGTEEDVAIRYNQILIDGGAMVIATNVSDMWEGRVKSVFAKYNPINVEDYHTMD